MARSLLPSSNGFRLLCEGVVDRGCLADEVGHSRQPAAS
jgi:hypothetical protein